MRPFATHTVFRIALACAACVIAAPGLRAQGAVLRGEVVDQGSGAAVAAARISVDGWAAAQADSAGRFVVAGLRAGDHRVRIERLGYAPTEMLVPVADSLNLTVTLKAEAQALEGVSATAPSLANVPERMRGFEFRRTHQQGSGRFITRADLEQSKRSTLVNVLRRLPGVRIIHGGAVMGDYLATGESVGPHALNHPPAPCFAQVFINGVQVYAIGRGDPPNLNEIDVNDIEAIEYYAQPSSTPAQFRTMDSDCGTLLLWMRFAR